MSIHVVLTGAIYHGYERRLCLHHWKTAWLNFYLPLWKGCCAAAGRGLLPAPVMHLSAGSGGGKGSGSQTACAHLFCTERNPDKEGGGSVWGSEPGVSGCPHRVGNVVMGWDQGWELPPRRCCKLALRISPLPLSWPRSMKDCGAMLLSWTARWPDILGCASSVASWVGNGGVEEAMGCRRQHAPLCEKSCWHP